MEDSTKRAMLYYLAAAALGAALYFLLALILRVEEAGAVLSLVKKKQ